MDTRIASAARPDIVMIESTPRPTPAPVRVSFSQVLSSGVGSLVQGAELAASKLPGSPIAASAIRGGVAAMTSITPAGSGLVSAAAEGPTSTANLATGSSAAGGTGTGTGTTDSTSGIDASLQESAQMNLYYLQIQQQVDAQNRSFTALSNVLKAEHDTVKGAIGNIHS